MKTGNDFETLGGLIFLKGLSGIYSYTTTSYSVFFFVDFLVLLPLTKYIIW
jgi:hypothetical protein